MSTGDKSQIIMMLETLKALNEKMTNVGDMVTCSTIMDEIANREAHDADKIKGYQLAQNSVTASGISNNLRTTYYQLETGVKILKQIINRLEKLNEQDAIDF